jgi:hypothetical protein
MRELPILFSTPMVQALLEGRKTQTRRIIKARNPSACGIQICKNKDGVVTDVLWYDADEQTWNDKGDENKIHCPYGKPGDVLWVREGFNYFGSLDPGYLSFKATYPKCLPIGIENVPDISEVKWKPSIHMPKVAARIWLHVKDVRVERLHDITEADAIAEGVETNECDAETKKGCPSSFCINECAGKGEYLRYTGHREPEMIDYDGEPCYSAIESYETLWQHIHGNESWKCNPWLWVVEFEVLSTTGKPQL